MCALDFAVLLLAAWCRALHRARCTASNMCSLHWKCRLRLFSALIFFARQKPVCVCARIGTALLNNPSPSGLPFIHKFLPPSATSTFFTPYLHPSSPISVRFIVVPPLLPLINAPSLPHFHCVCLFAPLPPLLPHFHLFLPLASLYFNASHPPPALVIHLPPFTILLPPPLTFFHHFPLFYPLSSLNLFNPHVYFIPHFTTCLCFVTPASHLFPPLPPVCPAHPGPLFLVIVCFIFFLISVW